MVKVSCLEYTGLHSRTKILLMNFSTDLYLFQIPTWHRTAPMQTVYCPHTYERSEKEEWHLEENKQTVKRNSRDISICKKWQIQ